MILFYFSKISHFSWVLQNIEAVKKIKHTEHLAFGTIDTWLVYKLTGGQVHATDVSNMSCTGIYDPFINGYGTIASMLKLPLKSLPEVRFLFF